MAVSLLSLLLVAAVPVLNVFLMCLIGVALARKGILDARARQALSQLVFWVFVPALVFTKLAGSVNLKDLGVWWILPFNMVLSISLGLVIGWFGAKVLKVDPWFRKHFYCTVALGNVGNLPIVLIQSICSNNNTPFAKLLPGGQCEKKGIAYIAFSMWIASTFQYCIAFNMLKKPPLQPQSPNKDEVVEDEGQMPVTLASPNSDVMLQMTTMPKAKVQDFGVGNGTGSKQEDRRGGKVQELVVANAVVLKEPIADYEQRRENEVEPLVDSWEQQSHGVHWWDHSEGGSKLRAKKNREVQRWLKGIPWGSYLNMPTLAAFAGLFVGCVSIVKSLMFGDSPPLLCLTQSLEIMAGGMIPCMMLILGGSLSKGPGAANLSTRVIVGTIVVRLIIMPAIGTSILLAMRKLGWYTPPDPLFMLILLLCHAPPTAMNLQTVATLNRNGEAEMSCILCWQYLAALVTLPLWMSLFVFMVSP